ncbi:hypothetical protein FA15DRAFT_600357 [Coprinopsis marcescibilis]|uniref:Phosphatidic acid phosphatase type 2/haloperoxidase domain-containing protein n=1 Tax=Coprinopsis marcescibilis TaxID=230819 RepID=A0A5C3KJG9_COPMA|nr:hypothetical protein FA15DRAFT_600357 [Coprinopsis marcescibilis]
MTRFDGPRASLDLTHVMYDDGSMFSMALALITLSPILLMASYASLAVQTREYLILVMWVGQLFGEGFNLVLKNIVKQARPNHDLGDGYGFPSSHSQYMGYFATFLICHLYFRHRFSTTGYKTVDQLWRVAVYSALLAWTGLVAYSRYYLGYHNANQVFWGLGIGSALGLTVYALCQHIPGLYPNSLLGQIKLWVLSNPLCTWLHIRDGWDIWPDAGREVDWLRWRSEWEKKQQDRGAFAKRKD